MLMGPGGIGTTRSLPTAGLRCLLGYYGGEGPSREKLERFIREYLVFDGSAVPDELVDLRYEASIDPEVVADPPLRRPGSPRTLWRMDFTRDSRLKSLQTPTLVVWGADDKVNRPSGGPTLARTLPDCTLLEVPQAGHWERAELFNEPSSPARRQRRSPAGSTSTRPSSSRTTRRASAASRCCRSPTSRRRWTSSPTRSTCSSSTASRSSRATAARTSRCRRSSCCGPSSTGARRYPNLRIQLAHAGGAFPFLNYRVGMLQRGLPNQVLRDPESLDGVLPAAQQHGFYDDTALNPAPSAAAAEQDVHHGQRHAIERANALAQLPGAAARTGVPVADSTVAAKLDESNPERGRVADR